MDEVVVGANTSVIVITQDPDTEALDIELLINDPGAEASVPLHALLAAAITVYYRDAGNCAAVIDYFTSLEVENEAESSNVTLQ